MVTRGGGSPRNSSAAAMRSTARSTTPSRSRRQLVVTSRRASSIAFPSAMIVRTMRPANARSSGAMARSSHTWLAMRSSGSPSRRSHAYSACSARARARVSALRRAIEAVEEIGHLQGGEGGVPPLVAVIATGACLRLFGRVSGEKPESDRHIIVRARLRQTARGFTGDVVEVRRLAANHRSDDNERIVPLGGEQPACGGRELPRARHPDHVNVLTDEAVPDERIDGAVGELLGNGLVEAGCEDRDATPSARGCTDELSHSVREEVTELVALGVEVALVFRRRGRDDRNPILDAEPVSLETDELARVVRHRPNGLESKIEQNLRADAVVAKVGLESQALVGLDRVGARVLQLIRLELVQQADAATFLVEIDHDPAAALLNGPHRRVQLPSAVASQRAEHVAGETLRVHPDENPLALAHVPEHESNVLSIVNVVPVADHAPLTVLGGQACLGDAMDEPLGPQAIGDKIGDGDRLEVVSPGKLVELGSPRGGAVVVENLADHSAGIEP